MSTAPSAYIGFQVNERLRIVELIEERPYSLLFKGEVLALDRVVGTCSVAVYRPAERTDPDDVVSALRASSKDFNNRYIFGAQQVGVIRTGDLSGTIYATGEPVTTTLSLDV